MKQRRLLLGLLAAAVAQLALAGGAGAYSLLLPDDAVGGCEGFTGLPYTALADHFTGPACVQMALNSCPTVAQRACHTQADLYAKILLHNGEPLSWFSDPAGIEGTLEDPTLAPCGNWSDFSNTDKAYVLGKMLYYMRTQRYFTPVSIGTGEHWVTVIGYETDVEPPFTGSVTLQNIFFYDPLPGSPSLGWVSGNVWLGVPPGSTGYWAAPHSRPGSSWDGEYLAVIEPPERGPLVRIPPWRELPRIPPELIVRAVRDWLAEMRLPRDRFEVLYRDLEIRPPVLVKAERPYYLVRFNDDRLAAVFSAAGQFEELRLFERPQRSFRPADFVSERLGERLRRGGFRVLESGEPQLVFRPELSRVGRVAPTWEVVMEVADPRGQRQKATVQLDLGGEVVGGLEKLSREGLNFDRLRPHPRVLQPDPRRPPPATVEQREDGDS